MSVFGLDMSVSVVYLDFLNKLRNSMLKTQGNTSGITKYSTYIINHTRNECENDGCNKYEKKKI